MEHTAIVTMIAQIMVKVFQDLAALRTAVTTQAARCSPQLAFRCPTDTHHQIMSRTNFLVPRVTISNNIPPLNITALITG